MNFSRQCGQKARLGPCDLLMRILITGGFGFIGGRLGQHFSQAGHQVVLGSRRYQGSPEWLPDVEVAKIIWDDEQNLLGLCEGIDVVIHAAGMNAQECNADPAGALEVNGVATAHLAQASVLSGVGRFVYLSTAHVYSSPLVGVITEQTCPGNLHPYASSHLAGEKAVLWAGRSGLMESHVVRLSNVFGAPADSAVNCWMLLANDLCRQVAETGRMALRSEGSQMRDFVAISQVCRTLEGLVFSSAPFDVLNLGSGLSTSVMDMARNVQELCSLHAGFTPEIISPSRRGAGHGALEYRSSRMASLAIDFSHDLSAELGSLLRYCFREFSSRAS